MKILVVSDLHYTLPQFDWLVEAAPAYDLVMIAGDLLDIASFVDPETQIIVVLKYLRACGASPGSSSARAITISTASAPMAKSRRCG